MAASLDSTDNDVLNRGDSDVAGEDFLTRLGNLNPTRKNLLRKYLSIKQDESFPLLSEYFGVALAFTALGALIRRANERKLKQGNPPRRKIQRIALESMLKRAMERLRDLAYKAQCLQDQLNEKNSKNVDYLERSELPHQLAEAEAGMTEMKRTRSEDTKANERVIAMFSTQDHWNSERKKLREEELGESNGRPQDKRAEGNSCIECKELDLLVNALKGELKEKEFFMVAAAEDAKVEQHELFDKLDVAEGVIESLKERLGAKFEDHQKEHSELLNQLQKVELELGDASEIINRARLEVLDMAESRKEVEALNARLNVEQKQLRKEVKDQEDVISTMIRRTETLKAENSELIEQLNRAKAKRRSMGNAGGFEDDMHEGHFSRRCSMADSQAVHQAELHSMYMSQITELEDQVNFYQGKVAQLEDCVLLRLNEDASGNVICFSSKVNEAPSRDNHIVHKSPTETDMEVKDIQLTATKNLLAQYINAERARELELGKWRKLYMATKLTLEMMQNGNSYAGFTNSLRPSKDPGIKQWVEAAKAQQAAELAERHWHEINAFERHMKAKDERMEALRVHLISLEREVHKRDSEIRELRSTLASEKSRKELNSCMDQLKKSGLGVTNSMQTEHKNAKKKRSRDTDEEQEPSLRESLERKKAELHLKDVRLSVLESKLVEVQMQYEKERKSRENEISEVLKEKEVLENLVKDSLIGVKESAIKNAIAAACSEVEKLSDKITEATEELKLADTKDGDHLREVIEQATEVSISGRYLKKIEAFLSAEKQDSKAPVNGTEQQCQDVAELDTRTATANMTNSASVDDIELRSDVDDLNMATREMDKRYEPSQLSEAEHALSKDIRGRETLEHQCDSSLAPMLKKQLRRYQCLLQRMNALSEQIAQVKATPTSNMTPLNSLLSRAVELRRQVDTSGRKLALIQAGTTVATVQVLEVHLREIQRRLEVKLGNMINDLRTAYAYEEPPHGGESASENGRLERGDDRARSLTAQVLLQNQVGAT